jgi:uncharacterized SAM-binding protein YcdF (DUF218 family)
VTRVVAVLGYSPRRGVELHPICAARLACAEEIARAGDVVVLSGWSRRNGSHTEADLMARAWRGAATTLVHDRDARHTVENAVRIAAAAREVRAGEVVVVTSWWHRPRAALLVRRAVGASGPKVTAVGARSPLSLALLARELACLALVPAQLRAVRRSAPTR